MKNIKQNFSLLAGLVFLAASFASPSHAQEIPKDYLDVLNTLGRKGDFSSGVLKVNVPRNDLSVSISGIATPTAFGFGGWIAMTKDDSGNEVLMGDLVLLQEEVNPVISALEDHKIDVTALHSHMLTEQPRLFFMHFWAVGSSESVAAGISAALKQVAIK